MHNMRRNARAQRLHRKCTYLRAWVSFVLTLVLSLYSAQSTLTNKSRLKLLHRREEHLQDLFSTAKSSILVLSEDEGRYIQFLEGVIVQGFLQLMESNVTVLARKSNLEIVKQSAAAAATSYNQISGREVLFDVEATLSDECVNKLY